MKLSRVFGGFTRRSRAQRCDEDTRSETHEETLLQIRRIGEELRKLRALRCVFEQKNFLARGAYEEVRRIIPDAPPSIVDAIARRFDELYFRIMGPPQFFSSGDSLERTPEPEQDPKIPSDPE